MTKILILDGGLGTTLETEHGCVFTSATTPLWSSHLVVSSPPTLLACQRSFARVPVDVLLTATYQASVHGFAGTVTEEHPRGIEEALIPGFLSRAIAIAEDAVAPGTGEDNSREDSAQGTRVALSLGPYGACMIPSQEYSGIYDDAHSTAAQLEAWHLSRTQLFSPIGDISSRVGLVALETIPRLDEITAMRRALHSVPELNGVPYWTSCLYPETGGEDEAAHYLLPDGSTAEDAVVAMLDPDIGPLPWGIGINCTKTWKLEGLLRRYETAVSRLMQQGRITAWPALVLYPDGTSGEIYNTETQKWELPTAKGRGGSATSWEEEVAQAVRGTVARGQWSEVLVGGCCMASPAHIKRLRDVLLPDKL